MADEKTTPEIMPRKEAKEKGLKRYFTGEPCSRGHLAERRVNNRSCIECIEVATSKWRRSNRKIVNDTRHRWFIRNIEKVRKQDRERERDKDERRKYNAEWRLKNPEWDRNWRNNNPEKYKSKVARKRARKANAEGSHTSEDLLRIFGMQKGKCAYCRKKLGANYQVDHIVPLYSGGSNYPNNIQLLCKIGIGSCNQRKNAKDPIDFAQSLGLLL